MRLPGVAAHIQESCENRLAGGSACPTVGQTLSSVNPLRPDHRRRINSGDT